MLSDIEGRARIEGLPENLAFLQHFSQLHIPVCHLDRVRRFSCARYGRTLRQSVGLGEHLKNFARQNIICQIRGLLGEGNDVILDLSS